MTLSSYLILIAVFSLSQILESFRVVRAPSADSGNAGIYSSGMYAAPQVKRTGAQASQAPLFRSIQSQGHQPSVEIHCEPPPAVKEL